METHVASGLMTEHAYGGAWPVRFEELVKHLRDLPGAQVVKPHGRTFEVVLVNNYVFVPLEYAKDEKLPVEHRSVIKKFSKLMRELLKLYGPAPAYEQPTIEEILGLIEDTTATEGIASEPLPGFTPDGVIIVYYAANAHSGVMKIGWGEAELALGQTPKWTTQRQWLNSAAATPTANSSVRPATVVSTANDQPLTRFDDGPVPEAPISARPMSERLNPDPVTAERPEESPVAHEQE